MSPVHRLCRPCEKSSRLRSTCQSACIANRRARCTRGRAGAPPRFRRSHARHRGHRIAFRVVRRASDNRRLPPAAPRPASDSPDGERARASVLRPCDDACATWPSNLRGSGVKHPRIRRQRRGSSRCEAGRPHPADASATTDREPSHRCHAAGSRRRRRAPCLQTKLRRATRNACRWGTAASRQDRLFAERSPASSSKHRRRRIAITSAAPAPLE